MSRDHADLLIDQLLREVLGGDHPRDMTARVLARAALHDRARRTRWIFAGAAIAASLAIAMTLIFLWPRPYPEPRISGVDLVGAGVPGERGTPLETGDTAGKVELGGYVDAVVDPHTSFTIRGKQHQEALALDSGSMQFDVTEKHGTFDVYVGAFDIHDTGTKFSVDVQINNAANPPVKDLKVNVTQGSVEVRDGHSTTNIVRAGEPAFIAPVVPLKNPSPASAPAPIAATRAAATATAAATRATAPQTAPATQPLPATQPAPATQPLPATQTSPATQPLPATQPAPATRPAPAANKPPPMPPLNPNVTMNTGSTSGYVIERNGKYSLINGQLVFDLPPPDGKPNGLNYLPGDYVTITWTNKAVTKAVIAKPPPSMDANMTIGPPK